MDLGRPRQKYSRYPGMAPRLCSTMANRCDVRCCDRICSEIFGENPTVGVLFPQPNNALPIIGNPLNPFFSNATVQILVVRMSSLQAVATALSSPMVDLLPTWFITAVSTPDAEFQLNAAELMLGVGLYAWIAYYLCVFLPYRMLFAEYQDYGRRLSQVRS